MSYWDPAVRCPFNTLFVRRGPVLSLAMTSSGEQCFSGGLDSTIQWWNVPSSNVDPYDTYGNQPALTAVGLVLLVVLVLLMVLHKPGLRTT